MRGCYWVQDPSIWGSSSSVNWGVAAVVPERVRRVVRGLGLPEGKVHPNLMSGGETWKVKSAG